MKLRSLICLSALAIAAMASAQSITAESKEKILESVGKIIETRAYVGGVDFSKWASFSERHKVDFMKAVTQDSFAGAVNKALDEFGFSHIQLLTPRSADTRVTGKSVGIGVLIQPDEKGIKIVKVLPGGPAEAAGVKVGDIIIKADGEKVEGPEKVRGPKGTKVVITVLREAKEIDLPIVRNEFSLILKDELEWIDSKTAMMTINSFATGYDRKLIDRYFEMIDGKAEKLVIDLHGNGGGAVNNLAHFAGKVLPGKASMGTFITRFHADEFKKKNPGAKDDPALVAKDGGWPVRPIARTDFKPFAGEVVVLIGPGSASASEIFASAIEDNKRGKVIGAKSAGAVLASTFMALPDGFSLQIPLMEYVTANGKRLEGTGVAPSITLDVTKLEEREEVMKAAKQAFDAIKREGIGITAGE
ncbi:MAG: S41 family peptidase [Armatimonadota bacterium]|nr:S41 family peptidase [Armatimonadota bacterium]